MDITIAGAHAITAMAFNSDGSYLVVVTAAGLDIFQCNPWRPIYHVFVGGLRRCALFFRSSLMFMIGNGDDMAFSPRRLRLWDTARSRDVRDIAFDDAVQAVRFSAARVVVVLEHRCLIYDLNLSFLYALDTAPNPRGVAAISLSENSILALPASAEKGKVVLFDANTLHHVAIFDAHDGPLSAIAIDESGTRLATASVKGTIVRVFEIPTGRRVATFRCGTSARVVYGLTFSPDGAFLAVSSDSDTLHVFKVAEPAGLLEQSAGGESHAPAAAAAPAVAASAATEPATVAVAVAASVWGGASAVASWASSWWAPATSASDAPQAQPAGSAGGGGDARSPEASLRAAQDASGDRRLEQRAGERVGAAPAAGREHEADADRATPRAPPCGVDPAGPAVAGDSHSGQPSALASAGALLAPAASAAGAALAQSLAHYLPTRLTEYMSEQRDFAWVRYTSARVPYVCSLYYVDVPTRMAAASERGPDRPDSPAVAASAPAPATAPPAAEGVGAGPLADAPGLLLMVQIARADGTFLVYEVDAATGGQAVLVRERMLAEADTEEEGAVLHVGGGS